MADKLKIYACSGVGQATEQSTFDYWKDNTNVLSNTQAVNSLAAAIEGNNLELQIGVSNERAIALLNEIDLFSISLYYAQAYAGNQPELERAGNVIGSLVQSGAFLYDSMDNDERDKHLDELFEKVEHELRGKAENVNPKFDAWWQANVMKLDQVGLTGEQQGIIKECIKSALPAKAKKSKSTSQMDPMSDPNIGKYLTQAGNYFLYTFFTAAQLKRLPKVFTAKAVWQRRIKEYVASFYVGVYGSEASMQQVIRNGIMAEFSDTPENICAKIANETKGIKGIGFSWGVFLTWLVKIIVALAPIITGIVVAVFDYKARVDVAQQQSLDKQIIEDNCMSEEDYDGINISNPNSKTNMLWIGAIIGGLWLLLKR